MSKLFSTPSSRRAVLGGAVGAVGATGAALAAPPSSAMAAAQVAAMTYYSGVRLYLTLTGIAGDSVSEEYPGSIELADCHFANKTVVAGVKSGTSDLGVGKSAPEPFMFSCTSSKASPRLFQFSATGKRINTVTLNAVGTPQEAGEPFTFLTLKLENAVISAYSMSLAESPFDEVELLYQKVTYTFSYLNESSTPVPVTGSFDYSTGKVIS